MTHLSAHTLQAAPQDTRVVDHQSTVWVKTGPSENAYWTAKDQSFTSKWLEHLYGPLTIAPPAPPATDVNTPVRDVIALQNLFPGSVVLADTTAWTKVDVDLWENFQGIRINGSGLFNERPTLLHAQEES